LSADGAVEDLYQKLDDTRFNLLLFGQPEALSPGADLGHLVLTHVVATDAANKEELARAQISEPSFYLLRPDGHVGLAGTLLDAATVAHYLEQNHLHAGAAAPVAAA
jgi:hypothetical protein